MTALDGSAPVDGRRRPAAVPRPRRRPRAGATPCGRPARRIRSVEHRLSARGSVALALELVVLVGVFLVLPITIVVAQVVMSRG